MGFKMLLLHSFLITVLDAFDGPQPVIVLGTYPNQTKPESQSKSENEKQKITVTDLSSQSNDQTSFMDKILVSLGKKVVQTLAANASSENMKNVGNVKENLELTKLPVLLGFPNVESNLDVKPSTSSPSLDLLEDDTSYHQMKSNNHNSSTKENETHLSVPASVTLENLNKTDVMIVDHEKVISNTTSSHSCEYGNFCSGFLILASSIYFHRTLNIV